MSYVFDFGHKHDRPPMEMKDLLGGKGANLAEMASVLGLPVPPGFTISTEACRDVMSSGWPASLEPEIVAGMSRLEETMGRRLGDAEDPLLVSVRSGAKFSMPGMMDTVLNLGLNDKSVKGLAAQTGDERFAYDSYRRFIQMFSRIVLGMPQDLLDAPFEKAKTAAGVESDSEAPSEALKELVADLKELVLQSTGKPFPQDPKEQLREAIHAVFGSWTSPRARAYRERERIDESLGTAVNVQAMVFGNRDDRSGTGVGFTRDPATGEKGAYGDFLLNAQGEDVVAGTRVTEPLSALSERFPDIYEELMSIFDRLEAHFRDMCDTEFTIEQGKLWMLQTRVGKRTGVAALRMAVEMVSEPGIALSKPEALLRVSGDHVEQVLHPRFVPGERTVLATGLGASPGAAVGRCYFSADRAAEVAGKGERVILVRSETSPEDVHGMLASQGVLTSRGGLVSHAAVVARGWGKPAVVGAEAVNVHADSFNVGNFTVREGDVISIDGTSGEIVLGEVALTSSEPPPALETLLAWADEVRAGRLGVRANADTAADAANARRLGAEGIGLCRTEHMFFGDDRLPLVRRMILAASPDEQADALEELGEAQHQDFVGILEAMDGLPVTVRLLDPPLHEFLPDIELLAVKDAQTGLDDAERRVYEAARSWHEENPMLGIRGVRLAVVKPELYAMQVRALMKAVSDRLASGGRPQVEVMIPLVVTKEEMSLARSWVEGVLAEMGFGTGAVLAGQGGAKGADRREGGLLAPVTIGTMIETPRAALCAEAIAVDAEFFSFGTNDLTQMTFGFSRDDVEGRMMSRYLELGLLQRNPFETIDTDGVGELVRTAVERGRRTRPSMKLGVCGEHGGDPESIAFFAEAGVDYVSCSPYRVPVARLASAQAVLRQRA